MADDDLRVRRHRFHARDVLADRVGPLSRTPRDVTWSDCGPWPSTSDDPVPATCAGGCGHRGAQSNFAEGRWCCSCWSREHRRRLETEAASELREGSQEREDGPGTPCRRTS